MVAAGIPAVYGKTVWPQNLLAAAPVFCFRADIGCIRQTVISFTAVTPNSADAEHMYVHAAPFFDLFFPDFHHFQKKPDKNFRFSNQAESPVSKGRHSVRSPEFIGKMKL